MTFSFFLPLIAAIALALIASRVPNTKHPRLVAFALTGAVATVGVTWTAAILTAALHYTLQHSLASHNLPTLFGGLQSHHVDHVLGIVSATALVIGLFGLLQLARKRHAAYKVAAQFDDGLVVTDSPHGEAFVLPGKSRTIVISQQLLDTLDTQERHAVLAHERAHVELHHYQFLTVASIAAAILPLLRPAMRSIHQALEMWADDEAVRRTDEPTVLVSAIKKASLTRLSAPFLALSGSFVASRVQRIEQSGQSPLATASVLATFALVAMVAVASAAQSHALFDLIFHVATH